MRPMNSWATFDLDVDARPPQKGSTRTKPGGCSGAPPNLMSGIVPGVLPTKSNGGRDLGACTQARAGLWTRKNLRARVGI